MPGVSAAFRTTPDESWRRTVPPTASGTPRKHPCSPRRRRSWSCQALGGRAHACLAGTLAVPGDAPRPQCASCHHLGLAVASALVAQPAHLEHVTISSASRRLAFAQGQRRIASRAADDSLGQAFDTSGRTALHLPRRASAVGPPLQLAGDKAVVDAERKPRSAHVDVTTRVLVDITGQTSPRQSLGASRSP